MDDVETLILEPGRIHNGGIVSGILSRESFKPILNSFGRDAQNAAGDGNAIFRLDICAVR